MKKTAVRSSDLLDVIHTNFSRSYYSRYDYPYLIKEKSESLDKVEIFRTKIKK